MTIFQLLDNKNKRIKDIPAALQKIIGDQQPGVLAEILSLLSELELDGDTIKINNKNLRLISQITDDIKGVIITDEYKNAVSDFAKEFNEQAKLNEALITKAIEGAVIPGITDAYIEQAKKNAIASLVGAPIDTQFIQPIQGLLENAVTSGASYKSTISNIRDFVEGSGGKDAKLLKYVKQITNDSFAIADRTYTNIVADAIGAEWYYYSGGEIATTRCFCDERVGKFFHYKEIESWGNGENLGKCDIGGGLWAGEISGTDASTIFNYAGGYNCGHSFMPVSQAIVPEADVKRAEELGYINQAA